MAVNRIPCVIMRGGTSKGVFLNANDLPDNGILRDKVILAIFGSPDARQIDGLGGADPLTSKLAIIQPSEREHVDIEYTFGQVAIESPTIDYSLTCGNILSGAAVYAIDEGLVEVSRPITKFNIYNTNTNTYVAAEVNTGGNTLGLVGEGVDVKLTFNDIGGEFTGLLTPTGKAVDVINLDSGGVMEVSIVDAGNLYVIIHADSLGISGVETPRCLEDNKELVRICQDTMGKCTELLDDDLVKSKSVAIKKLAIVSRYDSQANDVECDLVGRIVSISGKVHKSFAVTGAINIAFSAYIDGSIVNRMLGSCPDGKVTIGHPEGAIRLEINAVKRDGEFRPVAATIKRTARRIMDGYVYVSTP